MTKTAKNDSLIVGLHALPRAGKDTMAIELIARGYQRAYFAEALYTEVAGSFGVAVSELQSHQWKTQTQNLLAIHCSDCAKFRAMAESMGIDITAPQTSRTILQLWGTEYRRRQHLLYWVNEIDFKLMTMTGNIVVTDLRMTDEYEFLQHVARRTGRTLKVIEITRDNQTRGEHQSDQRLPDSYINLSVHNVEGDPSIASNTILGFLGIGTP